MRQYAGFGTAEESNRRYRYLLSQGISGLSVGREVPEWNTISISGYPIREAGSTAAQEIAFTLANAIAYVEAAIQAGLVADGPAGTIRGWTCQIHSARQFQCADCAGPDIDDGGEPRHEFGLEAELAGEKFAFVVPAAEFGCMGWVLRQLGPQAILYPGQQQHARAAIQYLSGAIQREHLYTHLGWRRHGADWFYLQAGGAIAAAGTVADLQVRLPAPLEHYHSKPPADGDDVTKAVRSSLDFLSVAPDRISLPLLAAVYRAPLGGVDFSLFLTGRTGTFKTALAALWRVSHR